MATVITQQIHGICIPEHQPTAVMTVTETALCCKQWR